MNYKYNINGIGEIEYQFYGKAHELLKDPTYLLSSRLSSINQLGTIRLIYNGAHYNRFEYLILQTSLVNNLKNNTNIGLGSKYNGSDMTGAEVLQLLFIFSNMGHFQDTFAANKVFLHILKENSYKVGSSFKKGIVGSGFKDYYSEIIDDGDYHKIQWLTTVFYLNRNKKYRNLCELMKIVVVEDHDKKYNRLYERIRKIAYLSMDLNYSTLPIEFKLSQFIYNKNILVDEVLKEKSSLFSTLERLNILLQETLYMENNVLLMSTQRALELFENVNKFLAEKNPDEKISISFIKKLMNDQIESPFYKETKLNRIDLKWDPDINLSITYGIQDKEYFPRDTFKYEYEMQSHLGNKIFFGCHYSPNYQILREVYAIDKEAANISSVNRIIGVACKNFIERLQYSKPSINNGNFNNVVAKKIITFFFRNILNEDYYCDYNYENLGECKPFIIANGAKKALKEIEKYIELYINKYPNNKDAIHEFKATRELISSIDYKGLVIVYIGSLRFLNTSQMPICELDGVIIMPRKKREYAYIIEAKNVRKKTSRYSIAKSQQEEKLVPLINCSLITEIIELPSFGSVLKVIQ